MGMPAPKGVIIISAPQNVIVNRIRTRAEKGWVGTLHRPIIHSDELLNQWYLKPVRLSTLPAEILIEQGISVFDLDAREEPGIW